MTKVQVLTPSVRLTARGEGELRLKVVGCGEELELQLQQRILKGVPEAECVWVFKFQGLKRGKYQGVLYSGGRKLAVIEFEVQRGLVEEDLGL